MVDWSSKLPGWRCYFATMETVHVVDLTVIRNFVVTYLATKSVALQTSHS